MKLNKLVIIVLITSLTGCGGLLLRNRFAKSEDFLYFGKYSGSYDKICKERNIKDGAKNRYEGKATPYKNSVKMPRVCSDYDAYLCRINITCIQHSEINERKACENDAKNYWIKQWTDKNGKKVDSVIATKNYCDRIKSQCDVASIGDRSCLE